MNSVGVDLEHPPLRRCCAAWRASARPRPKTSWHGVREGGAFTSRPAEKRSRVSAPRRRQCAGFLRLPRARTVWMRPPSTESYAAAKALLDACGFLRPRRSAPAVWQGCPAPSRPRAPGPRMLLGVGEPTLNDIVAELHKPGRDVHLNLPKPPAAQRCRGAGRPQARHGADRHRAQCHRLPGAFVDLGVHQDGLVRMSQISDKFIKHPRELLRWATSLRVKVLSVDTGKSALP